MLRLRVLIGGEFSGKVRDAFIAAGHDAMSADFLPTERPGPHYQGDVRDVWHACWDIGIFHPDCTHIAVSGARHFVEKWRDGRQAKATAFFMQCMNAPIPKVAVENPVCIMSRLWRKPDQIVQPWQFGHGETKATCLWLRGLPNVDVPLMHKIAEYAVREQTATLRPEVIHHAKRAIIDWYAALFPGSVIAPATVLEKALADLDLVGPITKFRGDMYGLLKRRWLVITAAQLAVILTQFLILYFSLRGVEGWGTDGTSLLGAFGAFALGRDGFGERWRLRTIVTAGHARENGLILQKDSSPHGA